MIYFTCLSNWFYKIYPTTLISFLDSTRTIFQTADSIFWKYPYSFVDALLSVELMKSQLIRFFSTVFFVYISLNPLNLVAKIERQKEIDIFILVLESANRTFYSPPIDKSVIMIVPRQIATF